MSTCSSETGFLSYFDENRLFYFLTTFTFAVIFIFIYILRVYTFFDTRSIPRAVRPSAPFGNIKDVVFQTQTAPHIQDTTLHIYLWKYYNKFKRKQFKYGGIYLFFKPSILVVDSALQQKIALNKSVSDLHDKRFSQDIVMIFNDSNLESFLGKYNAIKDSLLMDLSDKCVSVVMHNYFMETTSLAFGFKTSLDFFDNNKFTTKKKKRSKLQVLFRPGISVVQKTN
ncbi:hypothetical protein NQ315_013177 [Exocentrus adspersus]|uniref:ATP synthase F0 subunit 8 n=1 Tax=Exocentrus adspersus TaxID=1586481 RepID=A0AAV8VC35_9CUCU|nr:hypothetical protein NQ315_013177 [Exocentrus adspersus]